MADEQRSDDNTTPDGHSQPDTGADEPADATEPSAGPDVPPADAAEVMPESDATAALRPPVDPYIDDSETTVMPADQGGRAEPVGGDATSILPAEEVWTGRAEVRPAEPELRDGTPPPPTDDLPRSGSPRWWTPLLLGLLALLLLGAVILGVWLSLRDSDSTPAPVPTTPAPATTSAAPSPSPTVSPTAPPSSPTTLVNVPADLIGKTSEDAVNDVVAAGLSPSLTYEASDQPEGTVIAVSPQPGSPVPAGAQITLTIAVAPPASPSPSEPPASVSPSPSG